MTENPNLDNPGIYVFLISQEPENQRDVESSVQVVMKPFYE